MVKMLLDKAGIKYETVVADASTKARFDANEIKQAPTLMVNGAKYENASNIKKFIEDNSAR